MKNALIIAFLIFSTIASATDYYVSSAGNDSNNGLSSSTTWKTIAKVNSTFSIIKPGDRILFKRGDTFYGTITISKSGIAGNPISIGAYGTGANPVITGFTTITGWINEGNGIYSKVITSEAQTNMVTIDGVNTGMGRYPKSTYLTYESFSTNVSITDNQLAAAPDWDGAEVVIRKNDWTLDRCRITDHTGNKLSYTSLGSNSNATANYGYFIQNDLRCVTSYGDWYHNTSTGKFYMYFGTIDPSTKVVKVATLNNLIANQIGGDYITIDKISFTGSVNTAIDLSWGSDHCVMQNCSVSFAGEDGIRFSGSYGIIDNNSVSNCNRTGIGTYYSGTNNVITSNTIENIGIVKGLSKPTSGIWSPTCGIAVEYNNCKIQYNKVENVGYTGILISKSANTLTIQNNFIKNVCLVLDDGGGIYINNLHSSVIIDGNIILNSFGNTDGTTDSKPLAEGIYLDEYASNITLRNNTIAYCSNDGIKLHKAHDNIIQNNIAYNNSKGIGFENWSGVNAIYNNRLNGNIFFAKEPTQLALSFNTTVNEIPGFGTADNNYYARPLDDNYVINTNQPSTGSKNMTLAYWQSFTKQDANSHKSPIVVNDINNIRFEYNELKTNKVITLDKPMIDVLGAKYVNSITLLPFTSVVLMVDPDPTQPVIPVYTGSVIGNTTPALLEMTYNLSLANIVPAASAFTVTVNSIARNVNSVAVSGTKVLLTLSSPVVNGNVVTVAYTKPSTNPLQTTSGGQAASFSAQTVTNNVTPPAPPIYVSSAVANATPSILEMTYTMTLANIVPSAASFSVLVNSIARLVNSVAISGTKVLLTLASPIVYGDVVTISYTKPSSNPLQNASGGQAVTISAQPVTNNVASVVPVYVSSAIANPTPSILEMTYNLNLANFVPAASAFTVTVNSFARTVNSVVISGSKVLLTLASPIVYGDVVTVSYTKPSSNPLQNTSGGQAVTISAQPVVNNCINVAPTTVITSPIPNSAFTSLTNITITANATDADGSISMVEFYNGNIKLGSKSAAPYSFTWNNVPVGTYSLTVIAIDNLNVKTISSAISISVVDGTLPLNMSPVVRISNPQKGNTYEPLATITIDAVASDPDGTISKVEFYSGSDKLIELTSPPYSYTWKDVKAGTYSITATATDNLNATTTSSPIKFEVGTSIRYDANSEIFKLYPNPNDGHFSIEFINPLQNEKSNIVITDLAGNQVYNGPVSKEETLKQFDLSNSKSGVYIMMIKDKEILVTKKIIIH